MCRKLLSILVLSILVASTLVGCDGGQSTPSLDIFSTSGGNVSVMKAGTGSWTGAQAGMSLEVGDSIKTGDSSSAEITFLDGTTIELQAATEIEVASLATTDTDSTTIVLKQKIGSIIFRVTKVIDPASRYEVETPTGAVAVRGSAAQVSVIEDGTTRACNLEGDIWAIAQGVQLQIPLGWCCIINPGQPPELITTGALVSAFGPGGVATSNPGTGSDYAHAIAIDTAAMYVVGWDESPGNLQWRIEKRSLTDGSLVSGFGTGGVVTSNSSTGNDKAYAIAIDSTAMYVVGCDYGPGNNQWRIEKRSLTDGSLVSGFGTGGVVANNPSTGSDYANAIAIDSTAMYVVGYDSSPGNEQWRIEKRSLTDGSLDIGFDTDGVVTNNPSVAHEQACGIAIDSTAMYVVGHDSSPGNSQWRIEKRSLTDGSLDTGFDTDGVVTSNPSTDTDVAYDIAIDASAMYVVGYDYSPGDNLQWRIEKRSLTDGSLDTGFDTDGAVTSNPSVGIDHARAIAIDSTAMYVVGFDYSPGNLQWRIEKRSLTDGSLVPGFGTGGVVTVNPSTGSDYANAIAVDSTAMYVVGHDWSPGSSQLRIEKRGLTDGSLVSGFGPGGVATNNPSTGHDYANDIAIDSTAMYVVGHDSSPGNYQWRIEKRSLTDGSLVPAFGTGGVVTNNPSTGNDLALDIAIDSTAMYVVGSDSSPGNVQWRIEKRSLANGSLVSGFGTGGVVTSNSSAGPDLAEAIAIDTTAMYVVGYDYSPGNTQWRIEKRSLADGSLVSGFGTGGVVTNNPSTSPDYAYDIAIDSTAMYVVGYDYSPGNWQLRIEKRNLTDGSLVPAFGTGGVVASNPSTGYDAAYDIAIDSTAMYVVGFDSSPGNQQLRIEKRILADGSLVSGFGTGGVVTDNPSTGHDYAYAIAIDSTAMYVVGNDYSLGNGQWRIEKRNLTDGSLVSGFGTGGVVTSNPSTGYDAASGIAIDFTAMYVVGYDESPGNGQWRIEKRVK
jgi:predicted esterase YcpF (UPF0227 family)